MKVETDVSGFWDRGFIVVRNVFKKEEMRIVKDVIEHNDSMNAHAKSVKERSEGETRPSFESIFVWNDTAGADIFAKVTRSYKIVDRLEAIFGDEVYVYHNKIALKYPGVVGFSWHQDYGYWYDMGNLYPDMCTAFIAVDDATTENGCLRMIEGSHKMGRINHVFRDGVSDSGVDMERFEVIRKRLPEVPVELESGDVVIFHCNMLHGSDDNRSGGSRVALLGCYNTRHNSPYKNSHGHPAWHKQSKVTEEISQADFDRLPDFAYNWTD